MADEIKIWAIDRSSGENKVTEVGTTGQAETERLLEDVLVEKPEMLMPGLALIGRQTLTAGGPLDLLGVDQSGQLVVFELKRGTLTREAVAQVVDYASYLESLNYMELVDFITQNSRELTVGIDDFDEWWADISSEDSPETPPLKPVQMVLVGLGVDERAERMVRYLAQQGAPLALLTFHGYVHGEQTFLAKQVEISPEVSAKAKASSGKSRSESIIKQAEEWGTRDLLSDMRMSFRERKPFFSPLTKDGYSFLHKKRIILPGADRSYRRLFSIRLEEESKIRITFQPISVHLCQEEFDGLREIIPLTDSSSSELTPRVGFEYSCLLDADGWAQHKEVLLDFASAVYDEAGANATGDSQVVPEATKDDDENDV